MKRIIAASLMMVVWPSFADTPNYFAQMPPPPAASTGNPHLSAPPDAPLPSFFENKSVFDTLEVVGRTDTCATLRYPQAGYGSAGGAPSGGVPPPGSPGGGSGAAASMNFRVTTVKHGDSVFLGGRKYKVALDKEVTLVRLLDITQNRVVWEGDLSAPKSYSAPPNMADYQYAPPISAGAGISVEMSSPVNQGAAPR